MGRLEEGDVTEKGHLYCREMLSVVWKLVSFASKEEGW